MSAAFEMRSSKLIDFPGAFGTEGNLDLAVFLHEQYGHTDAFNTEDLVHQTFRITFAVMETLQLVCRKRYIRNRKVFQANELFGEGVTTQTDAIDGIGIIHLLVNAEMLYTDFQQVRQ